MKKSTWGDIAIKFVNTFELVWWNKGSGSPFDGAYYKPILPSGYYALGHYGQSNYEHPNGVVVAVKGLKLGTICCPQDYQIVWQDKSHDNRINGTLWKPIPPKNYLALGLVVTRNHYKPNLNEVMCVRRDIVSNWAEIIKFYRSLNTNLHLSQQSKLPVYNPHQGWTNLTHFWQLTSANCINAGREYSYLN